jgi:hypothetical protein
MNSNPGKKWPWIVVGSILGVVGLSYWTVKIALDNPVQMSDLDMQDYRHFEHNVNAKINAKILFDKKYVLEYVTDEFNVDGATVKFKLTTRAGVPVNDANITARITRPGTHEFDQDLRIEQIEARLPVRDGLFAESGTLGCAGACPGGRRSALYEPQSRYPLSQRLRILTR